MAVRAGLLTVLGQGGKLVILVLNLVVLGRLLSPEDFGLVALAFSLVGIAELLRDFGLSASAIQARNLSPEESSNLFWLNSGLGLILATLTTLAAWPLAQLFGQPALMHVIWGMSIVFLLNGVGTQFQAQLSREFRFGAVAATDVLAQLLGLAVGIFLALAGFGYWSLVALQVSAAAALLVMRIAVSDWRPSVPHREITVRQHLKFGAHLSGAQVLGFLANSSPVLALGLMHSTYGVGVYSRSAQLVNIPITQVFGPLTNVSLATLAKTTDEVAYSTAAKKLALLVTASGIAFFTLLAGTAATSIPWLLGDQWTSAVPVVVLLSIGAAFQAMTYPYFWIFLSLRRSDSLLRYNVVTKGMLAAFACAGAFWGVEGAAAGFAVGLAVSWPICALWLRTETRFDRVGHVTQSLKTLAAGSAGLVSALVVSKQLSGHPSLVVLALASGAWLASSVFTWLLVGGRRDMMSLASLVSERSRPTRRS